MVFKPLMAKTCKDCVNLKDCLNEKDLVYCSVKKWSRIYFKGLEPEIGELNEIQSSEFRVYAQRCKFYEIILGLVDNNSN